MYNLNFDWIRSEAKKVNDGEESSFVVAILNYDGICPNELYEVFNPNISPAGFPRELCREIQAKHGENWILHRRYEYFNTKGESFEDCNNRLIEELLQKTNLPIYLK